MLQIRNHREGSFHMLDFECYSLRHLLFVDIWMWFRNLALPMAWRSFGDLCIDWMISIGAIFAHKTQGWSSRDVPRVIIAPLGHHRLTIKSSPVISPVILLPDFCCPVSRMTKNRVTLGIRQTSEKLCQVLSLDTKWGPWPAQRPTRTSSVSVETWATAATEVLVQRIPLVGLRIRCRIGALFPAEIAIWTVVVMYGSLDQLFLLTQGIDASWELCSKSRLPKTKMHTWFRRYNKGTRRWGKVISQWISNAVWKHNRVGIRWVKVVSPLDIQRNYIPM